jgi:hypothetical protein
MPPPQREERIDADAARSRLKELKQVRADKGSGMSEYQLTPQAVADLQATRRHDLLMQGGHSCPLSLRLGLIVGRSVLIPGKFSVR